MVKVLYILRNTANLLAVAMLCAILPVETVLLGPLRPFISGKARVNPIWDPIYSIGWMFVPHSSRHNDTNPSPLAFLADLFAFYIFCLIIYIGYCFCKSSITLFWKLVLVFTIVGSLFVTIPVEKAEVLYETYHLHFLILETS